MQDKVMIPKILIIILVLMLIPIPIVHAEIIGQKLGTVNEVIESNNIVYYFETDSSIQSPTWIPDTKIMMYDGQKNQKLTDELFIYPRELKVGGNYLYFSNLLEGCIGQIQCDFQELVKMSKTDGTTTILAKNLKSAIQISVESNAIFVSESNGKIWKISSDGSSRELMYEGSNIIMDIASTEDTIYWIEEVADLDNTILSIQNGQLEPTILDSNLVIPYDLKVIENTVYWNEIKVKASGGHTAIKSFKNEMTGQILELRDTNRLISSSSTPHHGPYLAVGDFLFLVNNTGGNSIIQLIDFHNDIKYDIADVTDYDVKYLRNSNNFVYAIGVSEDGFVIERFALPVTVPEFSSMLFLVMFSSLTLTLFVRKLFR